MQAARLTGLRPVDAGRDPCDGLGLAEFGPCIGHDGSLPGFQSLMGHDPETDSTVVVPTDLTDAPDGRETANANVMAIVAALAEAAAPAGGG